MRGYTNALLGGRTGMISTKDYKAAYANCNFTCGPELAACPVGGGGGEKCSQAMHAMDKVGAYNIYNIYDTCGAGNMSDTTATAAPDTTSTGLKGLLELLGSGDAKDGEPQQPVQGEEQQDGSNEASGIRQETALASSHREQLEGQASVTGGPPCKPPLPVKSTASPKDRLPGLLSD